MEKHNTEWYKQRAREKRQQATARRNYQINRQRRDLAELEVLKAELLRKAKAERKRDRKIQN